MRYVIVGGRGWFGGAAAEMLRRAGERPLIASRRTGADLLIDAEDSESMGALEPGDIVIDAAGPFQRRSTRLIERCMALGCDVIDLSDSLQYARQLQALASAIDAAGIRVLNACSSVSAVSAALIQHSQVARPVRVSVFLAPATARTSTRATSRSLIDSLERTIQVRRGGRLIDLRPFSEARSLSAPEPVGVITGRLAESADTLLLPQVWPSLQDVDFWVDTRRRALNSLFAAAARSGLMRRGVELLQPAGRRLTKLVGKKSGGYAVEVEDAAGLRVTCGVVHDSHSYRTAVAPAVLAARSIASGRFAHRGLVLPDRQVDHRELMEFLQSQGMTVFGPQRVA